MLFIGVGMVSTVMPKYLTLVSIHKPLGIAILVLALIRLAVRLRYGAPPLPADLPEPMKLAAHLSHYALYALMIGMPLIGWAMLSAAAYPVVLLGRRAASGDPAAERQACTRCSGMRISIWRSLFFALILMHVAAALFHALVRRDGVFEAMAPAPTPAPRRGRASGVSGIMFSDLLQRPIRAVLRRGPRYALSRVRAQCRKHSDGLDGDHSCDRHS